MSETEPHLLRLDLLREAVCALESQVKDTPVPISPEVSGILFGSLGLDYATHVVERITSDLQNATRITTERHESSSAT